MLSTQCQDAFWIRLTISSSPPILLIPPVINSCFVSNYKFLTPCSMQLFIPCPRFSPARVIEQPRNHTFQQSHHSKCCLHIAEVYLNTDVYKNKKCWKGEFYVFSNSVLTVLSPSLVKVWGSHGSDWRDWHQDCR